MRHTTRPQRNKKGRSCAWRIPASIRRYRETTPRKIADNRSYNGYPIRQSLLFDQGQRCRGLSAVRNGYRPFLQCRECPIESRTTCLNNAVVDALPGRRQPASNERLPCATGSDFIQLPHRVDLCVMARQERYVPAIARAMVALSQGADMSRAVLPKKSRNRP